MAKKSNKKPNTVTKKDTALMMKRRDNNILHKRFTKIVLLLMILSFVAYPVVQLAMYIYNFFINR